jgi:hypothetical protein
MFAALAVCLFLSSTAFAGGNGGTKKDSTIKVRNDTNTTIAAFVDPNPALIAALPASPTQAQIEAAGGKVVNPGQTVSFKVKAGSYNLAVGSDPSSPTTASVAIGKGQTKNYAFNGSALVAF